MSQLSRTWTSARGGNFGDNHPRPATLLNAFRGSSKHVPTTVDTLLPFGTYLILCFGNYPPEGARRHQTRNDKLVRHLVSDSTRLIRLGIPPQPFGPGAVAIQSDMTHKAKVYTYTPVINPPTCLAEWPSTTSALYCDVWLFDRKFQRRSI
jgi:hypothetical protein